MRFEADVDIPASTDEVWAFLWDVPRLAACIPGCTQARELEQPNRYTAELQDRIGQFSVHFDLDVEVTRIEPGKAIHALAQGRDRRTKSHMRGEVEVTLHPAGTGSRVRFESEVQVLGRLGSLGHSAIKRRGEELMARFAQAARERIAAGG